MSNSPDSAGNDVSVKSTKRNPLVPIRRCRVATDGEPTQSITIVLPGEFPPEENERKDNVIFMSDYLPDDLTNYHTALGQFMWEWSNVEMAVYSMLTKLTDTDSITCTTIFKNINIKQAMDMILSLATDKLDDEGITNITNIIERVSRLNKKRNALVHGWWTLEVVVVHSLKRGAIIYPNFLREIVPATNKLRSNISNIKNQKDRAAHCFNYKRIIATARDALTLVKDIDALIQGSFIAKANTSKSE